MATKVMDSLTTPSLMERAASRLSGRRQRSAGGFIGREKGFDAHFLQGNILRRSEGCSTP
jgi:hypothetical protein